MTRFLSILDQSIRIPCTRAHKTQWILFYYPDHSCLFQSRNVHRGQCHHNSQYFLRRNINSLVWFWAYIFWRFFVDNLVCPCHQTMSTTTVMKMTVDDNDVSVGIGRVHRPHESYPLTGPSCPLATTLYDFWRETKGEILIQGGNTCM